MQDNFTNILPDLMASYCWKSYLYLFASHINIFMISSCIYEFIYIICFIIFFLTFGQLRFFKNLSVFERCLLLKSILKRASLFGTNCFVHYSRHDRYLGYLLSGVFTAFHFYFIISYFLWKSPSIDCSSWFSSGFK